MAGAERVRAKTLERFRRKQEAAYKHFAARRRKDALAALDRLRAMVETIDLPSPSPPKGYRRSTYARVSGAMLELSGRGKSLDDLHLDVEARAVLVARGLVTVDDVTRAMLANKHGLDPTQHKLVLDALWRLWLDEFAG